jgi:CRISPR-associated endonuclease/helicase Cas3
MSNYLTGYWGKAQPENSGPDWHPLAFHSLDVAAVAEALLKTSSFGDPVHRLHGGDSAEAFDTAIAIVALHDIGKFASGFQCLAPHVRARLAPGADDRVNWRYGGANGRHDTIGLRLWIEEMASSFADSYDDEDLFFPLMSASCGHHGSPPAPVLPSGWSLETVCSKEDRASALAFAQSVIELLVGGRLVPPRDECGAASLSLALAAVTNLADWIGSNQRWFRYTAPASISLPDYWQEVARPAALVALAESRVVPPPAKPASSFHILFPSIAAPTPLQVWAGEFEPRTRTLVIVEEGTGAGKTEAAQAIAGRLMSAGLATGVVNAMPTTITTNAMALRLVPMRRALFDTDQGAPFTLSHGRITPRILQELNAAGADMAPWIADDRRRALLAAVSVCTVDQALLAVLPARFASIRIAGLLGKVVIIDEVHSFDDYTGTLIAGLLRVHAALGGSAVLLSATLPVALKRTFATSFAAGAGHELTDLSAAADPAYPLVSLLDRAEFRSRPINPAVVGARPKVVKFIRSVSEAEELVLAAARAGRCVLWCRNTVDDAIDVARALAVKHEDVTAYHSRFPEAARSTREHEILERFGRNGSSAGRAGGIVVATQIIEQSLDVDFDLVVCDLKPIDAIIQTAGRGGRHARDETGTVLPPGEPDRRGAHELIILAPSAGTECPDSRWYSALLPRAAWVYLDIGALWRTAQILEQHREIRYPDNIRQLIEAVYGSDEAPPCFAAAVDRVARKRVDERVYARRNTTDPDRGYVYVDVLFGDDELIPTRLGDSLDIVLVQQDTEGRLSGLGGGPWTAGRLRLRAGPIDAGALAAARTAPRYNAFRENCPFGYPVLVEETQGRWTGQMLFRTGERRFFIDPRWGILFHPEDAVEGDLD